MRRVGSFLILMGLLLAAGCSEKQKAAARLEAQMKQQSAEDTAVAGEVGDTAISTSHVSADGASRKAESLTGGAPDMARTTVSQPVAVSDSALTITSGQPDTGRAAGTPQTALSGESELVPDAGAIPEEEKLGVRAGTQSGLAGGYVVQIASTPDRAYAQNLAATFVSRGYTAYVTNAEVKSATYFRVRIGRFATLTEARQIVAQLLQKYAVAGFVTQVQ